MGRLVDSLVLSWACFLFGSKLLQTPKDGIGLKGQLAGGLEPASVEMGERETSSLGRPMVASGYRKVHKDALLQPAPYKFDDESRHNRVPV